MKTFVVLMLLMITTIGFEVKAQTDTKYYVREAEVTKKNAIVYDKCYKSPITIKQNKDFIEIKTDSITFKSFVLKDTKIINGSITRSLLAANREQVYFIREFTHNEKYYLVVMPVKLTLHHRNLGGYGLRLVISNVENICDSIKFVK